METADQIFHSVFRGAPNVMSPVVSKRGIAGKYAYELSIGEFLDLRLYGVTLLDKKTGARQFDLDQCFFSYPEAVDYIKSLEGGG